MKKKSLLLIITAVIMVTALAVGGTLAYFTSTDDAGNSFTVGNVAIDLYEHKVAPVVDANGLTTWAYLLDKTGATVEAEENHYTGIYPGAVLPKDPTIRNTGDNPAYVRMIVTINKGEEWSTLGGGVDLTTIFGGFDSSKWTRAGSPALDTTNDTLTYVYNYNFILAKDAETGALFTTVTIPWMIDNEEMEYLLDSDEAFTIQMTAQAIQADGFAATSVGGVSKTALENAFSALDAQLAP